MYFADTLSRAYLEAQPDDIEEKIPWKYTLLTIKSTYQCLNNALPSFRRQQKAMNKGNGKRI